MTRYVAIITDCEAFAECLEQFDARERRFGGR
jgi:hypothetical protein